ncbi:MAG TPA: helix-turn-helix transcriptional regulator [Chthoniobacteraceae bacterium]
MLDPHTATVAELVKLLAEHRKQRGLSQETLALRAKLSRAGIGHMESGRTTPTLLSLLKIASVLKVDLFKLLRQAGQRTSS